ncbi:MAG TPA: DUF1559 domain-containing protein [Candidatus Paceibacterota bacterium]|nr:DUF1559 domain-containing protein [Candidatus Paceibacterota bacterium]
MAKAKARAQGIYCVSNTKQLTLAWVMYSDDHNGSLPYNLVANSKTAAKASDPASAMQKNWANNVLDWELSPDNTNSKAMLDSGIGPYTSQSAAVYRCPSDSVVSSLQQGVGWDSRVRSYSMNAMVGDAGSATKAGFNENNPNYLQFFKYSSISRPTDIFVFVDEHPDSIDDGYFLNKDDAPKWFNLPASYHDGAAAFSFADGHSEIHIWRGTAIKKSPNCPQGLTSLPTALRGNDLKDFIWVLSGMSVERTSEGYHY